MSLIRHFYVIIINIKGLRINKSVGKIQKKKRHLKKK
jgi:hypothetical protein